MSKKKNQLIAAFFALFLSLSAVHAQQRLTFGPRLGFNYSNITGDAPSNKFLPGLAGGVYLMYSDNKHFGFSADVLFSQKGCKAYDYVVTPSSLRGGSGNQRIGDKVVYDQRLNYIDVPLMARYFLNVDGDLRPNLFLGANAAFLLGSKIKKYTKNGSAQPNENNIKDFNRVELGLIGGVGMNIKIAESRWVQADLRYQYGGLTKIQSNPNRNNETISLMLAYGIGLGKK